MPITTTSTTMHAAYRHARSLLLACALSAPIGRVGARGGKEKLNLVTRVNRTPLQVHCCSCRQDQVQQVVSYSVC